MRKVRPTLRILLLGLTLSQAAPLAAEVVHGGEHDFTVKHEETTEAEPAVVYRTMTAHIDQWWNPEHSWSGKAANLHMEADRGGCFCERLPEGGLAGMAPAVDGVIGEQLQRLAGRLASG